MQCLLRNSADTRGMEVGEVGPVAELSRITADAHPVGV